MRKTFWIIGIALLFGWFGPTRAQADDITVISVNNLTVDGTSTCGPSSTSLCTVSISSNIEWDNTTDSIVGSPSTTTETNTGSGPYTLCVTAACVKFDAGAFDDTFTLFWSSPSEEIIYSTIMYAPPYLTPSSTAGIYANSECYLSKGGCASDFFSGPQAPVSLSAIQIGSCFVNGNPNSPCPPLSSGSGPGTGTTPTPEPAPSGLLVIMIGLVLVAARMRNSPA